jgi:hypothetical protein
MQVIFANFSYRDKSINLEMESFHSFRSVPSKAGIQGMEITELENVKALMWNVGI